MAYGFVGRCKAVHPGYGFLSENAEFVESCESAGVAFLGPTAATMRMFSRKHTAREFAQSANVPVLPGVPLKMCIRCQLQEHSHMMEILQLLHCTAVLTACSTRMFCAALPAGG